MRRRGRSTRSTRESDRSISIPTGSYQAMTGRPPTYRHPSGRTPKTIDMDESE